MTHEPMDRAPLEEPLAELERRLISEYLAAIGRDYKMLLNRSDAEAVAILSAASLYAATRLAEVESRAHYIRQLHGEP
jgi:hypothetical protein